jgi:hypothetical protein
MFSVTSAQLRKLIPYVCSQLDTIFHTDFPWGIFQRSLVPACTYPENLGAIKSRLEVAPKSRLR